MADEDEDDVVVSVTSDGEVAPAKKEEDAVGDDAVAALKTQYNDLQKRAEVDRTARADAERRAQDAARAADTARREADAARRETTVSHADTIDAGLTAARSDVTNAEAEYTRAMEEGNYAAAAKAQSKGSLAAARIVRLDEAKADIEARQIEAKEAPQRRQSQDDRAPQDPVEAYIAGRTEPTAKWLREHREWVTDTKKNAKLTAAHWSAIAADIAPDTDAYFQHVEKEIGLTVPAPKARRSAPPVAPVGAASGGGTNGGSSEVRLSKREAVAATDGTHVWNYPDPSGKNRWKKGDPIGVTEFARRKLKMTRDGLYDRSFTEG